MMLNESKMKTKQNNEIRERASERTVAAQFNITSKIDKNLREKIKVLTYIRIKIY